VLRFEWVPLEPGDRRLVQQLWRLYRQNGERNGQTGERQCRLAEWLVACLVTADR